MLRFLCDQMDDRVFEDGDFDPLWRHSMPADEYEVDFLLPNLTNLHVDPSYTVFMNCLLSVIYIHSIYITSQPSLMPCACHCTLQVCQDAVVVLGFTV